MISRSVQWVKSAIIKEDHLYCVYKRYSVLLRIHLDSWKYERVASLKWNEKNLVTDLYEVDGQIVCVPLKGRQAAVYDPESDEIRYDVIQNDRQEWIDTILYKEKIWLVPRNLPGKLYYYSLEEKRFLEAPGWELGARRLKLNGRIERKCFIENHQIHLVSGGKAAKYDLADQHMTEIRIPLEEKITDLVRMDDSYYCIVETEKRTVIQWKIGEKQCRYLEGGKDSRYVKLVKTGRTILLDAAGDMDILADGRIRRWQIQNPGNRDGANVLHAVRYGDRWILLPWSYKAFIVCSLDLQTIEKHEVRLSVEEILAEETSFPEAEMTLKDYLACIIHRDGFLHGSRGKNGNGKVIYEHVRP